MSSSTASTWTGVWDLVDIWISSCFFFWELPPWCIGMIQLCSDYRDHEFDDRWFHVTWFLTYRTSDAILGHIPFHLEIYGSSWTCTIIITYWMLTETLTYSLPYHDTSVDLLWIYLAKSSFFGIWLPSCFIFRDTFPRCLDLIWIIEITYSVIDDSMSPDFLFTVHSIAILEHISVLDEIYKSWWSCTLIPTC